MTNATANAARAQMIADFRATAEQIRTKLSARVLMSHGYIVTRDGDAMDVRRYQDGTWATMSMPTKATRWIKEDATTLAAAFAEESEGEWRAEYWRDAATRYLEHLEGLIASLESRTA